MKSEDVQLDADFLLNRAQVEQWFGIPKRYLEVADLKGCGPRQVRLGRSVRYRVQDIRSWIDQCAAKEPDAEVE